MRELAAIAQLTRVDSTRAELRPSKAEVRAAAEPHLPILVHKRAKAFGGDGADTGHRERWSAELERLASRWSHLASNDAERSRLVQLLEEVVQEEQLRSEAEAAAMPVTSRFDTSWAI